MIIPVHSVEIQILAEDSEVSEYNTRKRKELTKPTISASPYSFFIFFHFRSKNTPRNDVCLLYLEEPLPLDEKKIAAISLGDGRTCAPNSHCVVSGWGRTRVPKLNWCFVPIKAKLSFYCFIATISCQQTRMFKNHTIS